MTTTTTLDLNGSDPSLRGEYGIGPDQYWSNTSSSGSVTFNRAQNNPFYGALIGLASGIRSVLISPDQNAVDLGGVQLDWRLGWHQTLSNGELSYTAPRIAFGVSSAPQSYTFSSGGTNYTVTASTVARQATLSDGTGSKTVYDLKLEASTALPSSAMQDLLRQVGIEYRQGSTPPVHQRDIELAVKISADGANFVGAPAGQAGSLTLELDSTPSFPLHAAYSGKIVALSFGAGDLAVGRVLETLSFSWDARFGQPPASLFGLEVRPAGAAGPVDSSFSITEVVLEQQALLILNKAIPAGAQVRVSYSDPADNQISNVVQDWRGNDALSSSAWITALPLTTGRSMTALAGAQLGISTDGDFPFGLYVADADGAGLKADSVVRVTAVNTSAGTYTVEVRPDILFPNPSYDPAAAAGSFRSYRYSNEAPSAELKPKVDQPLPVVGSTSTLLDFLKLSTEPLVQSHKLSVFAAQTESVTGAVIFDLGTVNMPAGAGLPLSLAITGLASAIGNDTLTGSASNDTLEGWWGNDSIDGAAGNDTLDGGDGNDSLSGGAGSDRMLGGAGDDQLLGGLGNDRFFGGAGSDTIHGGEQRRVPWIVSNPDDYDILDYSATSGITLNLGARSVAVAGEAGTDSYSGIEEVQGAAGAKDTVSGRLTASAAEVAEGGSSLYLYLRGGSDVVNQQASGSQQLWLDGVHVGYHWSLSPIELSYVGGTATVSYAAATSGSQTQLAGTDTLTNVVVIGDSAYADSFNLSAATLNQLGFVSDQRSGMSWHTLLMGRGGSDTVIGNGLTTLSYSAVTTTNDSNGVRGLSIDLKAASANLSGLSTNGVALGTLTFSGVRGLNGTKFNDTLIGGRADNDPFETFRGEAGNDSIDGGSGYDRAEYRFSLDGVTVNLAAGTASSPGSGDDTLRSIEAIRGSMFADTIDARGFVGGVSSSTGNVGSFWWGGNDIAPEGGNDTIFGNGATFLIYESAMVPIRVDLAAGVADARIEADKITPQYSTIGRDTFSAVYGVRGSQYDDELLGGGAGRTTTGVTALEVFQGGAGNDTIDGLAGWDVASYWSSPAAINVNLEAGTVQDGWGFVDTLRNIEEIGGTFFADTMLGSDRNELFNAGKGADSIDGAGGYDEVGFTDSWQDGGVKVYLSGWVGTGGALPAGYTGSALDQFGTIDFFRNIEGAEGSNGADLIRGNAGDNRLDGRGGADTLEGGEGIDWAEYNQATRGVVVDLNRGLALDDGQGLGSAAPEVSIEQDVLTGIENVQGGTGDDSIVGDANANELVGESGDDALRGGAGNDTLDGGADHDYLQGGAGSDALYGRSGDDVLTGYEDYDDSKLNDPLFAAILQGEKNVTDSLYGGQGNDFYLLDKFVGPSVIVELENEGIDTVLGDLHSYVLPQNVENYINDLSITENGVPVQIRVDGNGLANWIQSSPADWELPLDQLLGSVNQGKLSAEAFFGFGGADTLLGGGGGDLLDGGQGNDLLDGGAGNDTLIGGEGVDTAQYRGKRADYEVTSRADGSWTVRDLRLATTVVGGDQALDGQDTLSGVEWLKFQDATVSASSALEGPLRFEVNGHWYEFVATPSGTSWTNALAQAATKFHRGQQGYLATITTALEDDFVYKAFGSRVPSNGGIAIAGSDGGQEGLWKWMAGPESGAVFAYSNWGAGEPNDSGGTTGWLDNQDYAGYLSPVYLKPGKWADAWNSPNPGSTDIWAGYVVEYGGLPASYTVTPLATSVSEGSSVTFTVNTKNVEWGTEVAYTITGISQADLASGALTGTVVVNSQGADGQATITVHLLADQQTEGTETLTVNVMGQSASVQVSDTSKSDSGYLSYQGKLYTTVEGPTWAEAEARALALGGHLVTINDAQEDAWLRAQFVQGYGKPLWIGLSDQVQEGRWVWSSGETSAYRNWFADAAVVAPDNKWSQGEDFAVIGWDAWGWNDVGGSPEQSGGVPALRGIVEIDPGITLLGLIPGNGQDIAPGINLSLKFAAPVRAGTGSVVLVNLDDPNDRRIISITDAAQVRFRGSTVVINPADDLAVNARYSVTVPAGAIEDTSGRVYAGTNQNSPWIFTTGSATQWQSQYSDQVMDIPNAVALDASGRIYMVGQTVGGIEGQNLDGLSYPFVSQFSPTGQLNWVSRFGTASTSSTASVSAYALAVDSDGSVLVGGELGTSTQTGGRKYGLAKYDPSGRQLWIQTGDAQPYSGLRELLVADDHSIVGGGRTYTTLSGSTGPTQANNLIVKHDAAGNLLWSRVFGTSQDDSLRGLAAASDGGYYASWTSSDSAGATQSYLTRFDAQGVQSWQLALGSAVDDPYAAGLVVGKDGQVFFAGSDRVAGQERGFLAQLSSSGQQLWRIDLGSSEGKYISFLQLTPDGNLWVSSATIGADGKIAGAGGVSTLVNSHNGAILGSLQSDSAPIDALKQINNAAPNVEFWGSSMIMAVTTAGAGSAAAGAYLVKTEVPLTPVFAIGSSRYRVVAGASWTEAESAAQAIGAHLVTINSAEEDAALTQIMGSEAFKKFYSDLGRSFSYNYRGFDFATQTKTVALGSAYWIGLSMPPDGLGLAADDLAIAGSATPAEGVWSSGEASSYRGQISPNNELDQGLFPLPAVAPTFGTAYAMKIGAGASDQGTWAYTGSRYPTNIINPYRAMRGLAEITAQDALHIEGSKLADVLMSDGGGSQLSGLEGNDWLLGNLGDDTLIGAAGNDTLQGGAGFDTAVYSGARSNYTVTRSGGSFVVTDKGAIGANEGTDRLSGIEQLRFSDGDISLSSSAPLSGKAYFWNNTPGRGHALLSGVNLVQLGGDTPSDSPVYLKNGGWDSNGRAFSELWLRSAEPVTSFEIDFRLPQILGSPQVTMVAPPQGYNALHFYDSTTSNLRLAGFGLNGFAAGEFKLADISIDLPANLNSFTVEALTDKVNREDGGPWSVGMSRAITGTDGSFNFTPLPFEQYGLKVSRPTTDAGSAISALDALAALKLSAGLNPNTDPDGAGPLSATPVSPYQLIAADVSGMANGPDGKVTASDALGILKKVLGMPDAPVSAKTWALLAENTDLSGLNRKSVVWDELPYSVLNSDSSFTQNVIGVLRGDVDGDWRPPAGSSYIESLDPLYFSKLAQFMNVSESQWSVL